MTPGRCAVWLAAAVSLLSLGGCVTPTGPRRAEPATRPLAPPAAAGERSVSQVVRASRAGREMTLSAVVSIQGNVMTVVGLNALGVRLFTIRYDGQLVGVEKISGLPEAITPERLLADLQLVYWPLAALRVTLQPAGFEIGEPDAHTRRLRHGDRDIAEVRYDGPDAWTGHASLENLEFGYALQIDTQPL